MWVTVIQAGMGFTQLPLPYARWLLSTTHTPVNISHLGLLAGHTFFRLIVLTTHTALLTF